MSSFKEEAAIQLTDERKRLSAVLLLIKLALSTGLSKRAETTLALRGTERAFMWLGKAKGVLGITNPYPKSTDPSSPVIEPPVDVVSELSEETKAVIGKGKDEIVFAKHGRALLGALADAIRNDMTILEQDKAYQLCIANAWTNAEEAKMYLGLVLGLIRDESKPAAKAPAKDKKPTGEKPAKKEKPVKVKEVKPETLKVTKSTTKPEEPSTDAGNKTNSGK